MDEIHEIRAEVGADACSLITMSSGGGGYCGVAYLGNGNSLPFTGFSVSTLRITRRACSSEIQPPLRHLHRLPALTLQL